MEKRTRAYRRYKKEVKFKKRLKKLLPRRGMERYYGVNGWCSYEEYVEQIKKSQNWTWLKTTSTPCSCDMCSYQKYRNERTKENRQAMKEAWKEIEEI